VLAKSTQNVSGLKEIGCDIVGDLSVLEITDDLSTGEGAPSKDELLAAAVDGIAGLLVHMGRMRDDRRNAEGRLRRQLTQSASMVRTRTRVAAVADRTRLGSAALTRYREFRGRHRRSD